MFKTMGNEKLGNIQLSAQSHPSRRERTELSTPEPTFKKQDYVGEGEGGMI